MAFYILPSAGGNTECDVMNSAVAKLQTQQPTVSVTISGDFNHQTLDHQWPERASQQDKKSLHGERKGIIEVSTKRTKIKIREERKESTKNNVRGIWSGMKKKSQGSSRMSIREMEVWTEPMKWTCSPTTSGAAGHLLGEQHQSQWLKETEQTDEESWLCSGASGADCAKEDTSYH